MKKLVSCLVVLFCISSAFLPFTIAHAHTTVVRTPDFSLYTDTSDAITHAEVTYNLEKFSPSFGSVGEHADYYIATTKGTTFRFSIPFLATANQIPDFAVTLDGSPINGYYRFGNQVYTNLDDFDVQAAITSMGRTDISDEETGTLYHVTPTNDTFTVYLEKAQEQGLILETSNQIHSFVENDRFSITMSKMQPEYCFYITNGDFTAFSAVDATITKEALHPKDFIDRFYHRYLMLFKQDGTPPPIDFYYFLLNSIRDRFYYSFSDFFFSSYAAKRWMSYEFAFTAEKEAYILSYDTVASAQPIERTKSFLVEQIVAADYPINYRVQLCDDYPHLLESSTPAVKRDSYCTFAAFDNAMYFVFGAEKTPDGLSGKTENTTIIKQNGNLKLILPITISGVLLGAILIYILFRKLSKQR